MKTLTAAVALLLTQAAARDAAATVKFRILVSVDYVDSGLLDEDVGLVEDRWNDPDGLDAAMRGASLTIYKQGNPSQFVWSGELGDGIGAGDPGSGYTPTLGPPGGDAGTYEFYLESEGLVNGNTLSVQNENGSTKIVVGTKYMGSGGTADVLLVPQSTETDDVFNVYAAEAFALHIHGGGMSGETLVTQVGPTPCSGGSGSSCNGDGIVYIADGGGGDGGTNMKFIIVHELGHQLGNIVTHSKTVNGYSSADPVSGCPAEPTGQVHSMRSGEYAGGGLAEGLAHFYAADVWNDDAEDDCFFAYYKTTNGDTQPGVDCESTLTPDFPVRAMESRCDSSSWPTRGTELDWLRTFWDLHTNGSSPYSFTYIVDTVLDGAAGWSRANAYTKLCDRADALGTPFSTSWYAVAPSNGIDHP